MPKEPEYPKEIFTYPTESENSPAISSSSYSLEDNGGLAKRLKLDSDSQVDLWDKPKPATPHKPARPSTKTVYINQPGLFSTNFTSPPRGS
jgi:hypothetical protein